MEKYVIAAFLLLIIAVILIKRAVGRDITRKKPSLKPVGYRMIYTDQPTNNEKVIHRKILYSSKYNIQGKPDYVFESPVFKRLLPVELKSGSIADKSFPNEGDLLQLAAYFLILEDVFGQKVRYGRLIYRDCMFVIKNTGKLRKKVKETVKNMRLMLEGKFEGIGEYDFAKCRYCMSKGTVCEFAPKK